MSNPKKDLRNQLRQLMPEVLETELVNAVYKKIAEDLRTRLQNIDQYVKDAVAIMEQRSKDAAAFVIRAASGVQPPKTEEKKD